jgi:hypothetical protein
MRRINNGEHMAAEKEMIEVETTNGNALYIDEDMLLGLFGVAALHSTPRFGNLIGDLTVWGTGLDGYWQVHNICGEPTYVFHYDDSLVGYITEGYVFQNKNGFISFEKEKFQVIDDNGIECVAPLYQTNVDYELIEWWILQCIGGIFNKIESLICKTIRS